MGTLGNTTTPGYGWNSTSRHNIAGKYTNSTGGQIQLTTLHAYLGGNGGTATGELIVWNSVGDILWQSGSMTFAQGAHNAASQDWYSAAIPSVSQPVINNGDFVYIGWWTSNDVVFSVFSSGLWYSITGNSSAPSSFVSPSNPGSPLVQGGIGSYADYVVPSTTPTNFPIRRSGAWSNPVWKVRRSSAWSALSWYIRRSGAWTQIA